MRTASASPADAPVTGSPRWVIFGANLPFALFTGYAVWIAMGGARVGGGCLVEPVLGWCPGCGLTGDYARILTLSRPEGWYIWVILSGFAFNAAWSVRHARRIAAKRSALGVPSAQPA